jgi:hypothetical protein
MKAGAPGKIMVSSMGGRLTDEVGVGQEKWGSNKQFTYLQEERFACRHYRCVEYL